jgi:hypothetical protein
LRRGIFRKHGRGRTSQANISWEKSMHSSKPLPARRLHSARETARCPVHDLHGSRDAAIVIPYLRQGAPRRRTPAVSTQLVRAVTAFSRFAIDAIPNLLLAVVSWIIEESMAGCAAYAEAMYGIPLAAAEPQPAEIHPETAVSLTLVPAQEDGRWSAPPAHAGSPARAAAIIAARPDEGGAARTHWYSLLAVFIAAGRSLIPKARERRQATAELRGPDDRPLGEKVPSASEIEAIAWRGMWRE